MNLGDVKASFLAILNRRDVTQSQIDTFVKFAMHRIDREVRVPSMEKMVIQTIGTTAPYVPGDLLETISLSYQNNQPGSIQNFRLERVDLNTALASTGTPGYPAFYARQGGTFLLAPNGNAGDQLYINYYASAGILDSDSATNWVTVVAPDLLAYAMLTFAGDFYVDERKDYFNQRYAEIVDQLSMMSKIDDLKNASMQPAYHFNDGYDGDC